MIKITCLNSSKLPTDLLIAVKELQILLDSLAQDIDQLPIVTFDPRYTKPVNLTSVDIIQLAIEQELEIKIDTYTQGWFDYKMFPVNAYVVNSRPDTIHFNTRMFKGWNKNIQDYKRTISHEIIHLLDMYSPYTFNHGKNNLKGKDETAPVKLSKILTSMTPSNRQIMTW